MTNNITKVGVVGGSGFTAGELIRILLNHPVVEISWVFSRSNSDEKVSSVHTDLFGITELKFTDVLNWDIEAVFLCLPHETARTFVVENEIPDKIKIIDLSRDYRLNPESDGFVYGLPELHKSRIQSTSKLANPGCFATAIQLSILPLLSKQLISNDLHITGITGSTGAGKSLSATTHFTWRNSNASVYKVLKHQHVDEIQQTINVLQENYNGKVNFVPMRGNFTRGILVSLYTETLLDAEEALEVYKEYYSDHPFVDVTSDPVDMKQVVGTNRCLISVIVVDNLIHVTSVIDNLVKGASGQAVQNFNLMCGFPENTGLKLKSISY